MKTSTSGYSLPSLRHWFLIFGTIFYSGLLLDSVPAHASTFKMLHRFQSDPGGTYLQEPLIRASDGSLYGTAYLGGQYGAGTVFKLNQDGSGFTVIKSFTGDDGASPLASVCEASDGFLYGTTSGGGAFNSGVLFKLSKDGSSYVVLRNFNSSDSDGGSPQGPVIEASDGALYGTTTAGSNGGVLFKVNKDGSNYIVRHGFNSTEFTPLGALVEGNDGAIYGVTRYGGGAGGNGTIYRMTKDGSVYSVIKSFNDTGSNPFSGLIKGPDGTLYGTTYFNTGTSGSGIAYKISPDGNNYTVLHAFSNTDGANPYGSLVLGSDGILYGTTESGGNSGRGTVFSVHTDGSNFTTLRSFSGPDGFRLDAGLVEGIDGALYGVAYGGGALFSSFPSNLGDGCVFKIGKDGNGFSVLKSFSQGDGMAPKSPLLLGSDNYLYGTTSAGGTHDHGVVFKVNSLGSSYAVLHDFSPVANDGQDPLAELIEGADGALYGTTSNGGISGLGTVYKINKDGSGYTVLYNFSGTGGDGQHPSCALFKASDGLLYGTTQAGGSSGNGTVFKMNPDGTGYAVILSFTGTGGDGGTPYAGVIEASNHSLYGVCMQGGANAYGTVFTLKKDGTAYSVMYSFAGGDNFINGDGAYPQGALLEGNDGYLYGTTSRGGTFGQDRGTVFKLDKSGNNYDMIYYFDNGSEEGSNPTARLIQSSDNYFYGALHGGNASASVGTVFKLDGSGNGYTILYTFDVTTGDGPNGVTEGADGALYGSATTGAASNKGALFKLNKDGSNFSAFYTFNGDGSPSTGALLEGSNGILYGVTYYGGASDSGSIFQINKDGSGFAILHSFDPTGGYNPYHLLEGSDGMLYGDGQRFGSSNNNFLFRMNKDGSGYTVLKNFNYSDGSSVHNLFEGSDGKLYGAMSQGGSSGQGTIFRISKDGSNYLTLYTFTGTGGDGSSPNSLIEGSDHVLYGTTAFGNALGYGNAFKINMDGNGYTIIHYFAGYNENNAIVYDGTHPSDIVELDANTLAGLTASGGSDNMGVYFTMDKSGNSYTIPIGIHFLGATANNGVVKGDADTYYGTTLYGGTYNWGEIFSLNAGGTVSAVLKTFLGSEGEQPHSLVFGSDGAVYGLAQGVFRLSVDSSVNPPTLDAIHNLSLSLNPGAQTVNLTGITDGDNGSQTLTVTATCSNTGLIPNLTVDYTNPSTTGALHFTPANGVTGTAVITVKVQDNGGGVNAVTRQFIVSVVNPTALSSTFVSSSQIHSSGVSLTLSPLVDGTPYRVQFSTDLSTWVNVSSFTAFGSSVVFNDPGATNHNAGYYRLITP